MFWANDGLPSFRLHFLVSTISPFLQIMSICTNKISRNLISSFQSRSWVFWSCHTAAFNKFALECLDLQLKKLILSCLKKARTAPLGSNVKGKIVPVGILYRNTLWPPQNLHVLTTLKLDLGTLSRHKNALSPENRISSTSFRRAQLGKRLVNRSDHVDALLKWKGRLGAVLSSVRPMPAHFSGNNSGSTATTHSPKLTELLVSSHHWRRKHFLPRKQKVFPTENSRNPDLPLFTEQKSVCADERGWERA